MAGPSLVTFRDAFHVWLKIALLSFGGPTGQIAVMHRLLVDERRWISESRFLHALNYCMLLPGPEAHQLVTYTGWLMFGVRGGLVAGLLFILPGAAALLALSILYVTYQETGVVQGLFFGLKAAVLAVVVEAVLRISRRVLKNRVMRLIAAVSFLSIHFFAVPFPVIIATAAAVGLVGGHLWQDLFHVLKPKSAGTGQVPESDYLISDLSPAGGPPPTWLGTLTTISVGLAVWWTPVLAAGLWFGFDSVFVTEGVFFSQAALVTFGGAYAVLPFVAQQAVEKHGWLSAGEMLDGLGMAETTPGPLIIVLQFVGFLGAYRDPEGLPSLTAGVLGSALTTWVTFAPSFLWIFVGAPWIERLRGGRVLSSALSSVTAAVVGVVLNLAVWFAQQTLIQQGPTGCPLWRYIPLWGWGEIDAAGLLIAVAAGVALLGFHVHLPWVLAASAGVGWLIVRLAG